MTIMLIIFGIGILAWAAAWRGAGILAERNKIVDFLGSVAKMQRGEMADLIDDLADAIGRGAHRR